MISAQTTRVVIIGASGRMGSSLLQLLPEYPQLTLHGTVSSADCANLERVLQRGGLAISFSSAASAAAQVRACAAAGVPLVLGTTGLGPEMPAIIEQAARLIPLLVAANTSLGVTVLLELVRRASSALGTAFDIQIQETHHRAKVDAPSGTALALGAAAAEAVGGSGRVGYASLRGGDVVGEHQVHFLGAGERLLLGHSATDRSIFARGALQAGLWLARQRPGNYGMADSLI